MHTGHATKPVSSRGTSSATLEREAQDAEYDAAVRADGVRDGEERQREEAEQALAGPVRLDVVRAARVQRLAIPTSSRGTSPTDGVGNS